MHQLLSDRIEKGGGVGVAAGVTDGSVSRFYCHGRLQAGGAELVTPDTVFEAGSITKIFTALLLADKVAKGEVALGDSVSGLSFLKLATHTSGLPRMPASIKTLEDEANFGAAQMDNFLSTFTPPLSVPYAYSNLGYGLLAHALAKDYAAELDARIFRPMGMDNTAVGMATAKRRATGHSAQMKPVADLKLDALAGSGSVCSTARDLLKFIAANLRPSPLLLSMRAHRRPASHGNDIALGWHICKSKSGADIYWHNGGTMGFQSFMGFTQGKGVVILANANTRQRIDSIGMDILQTAP